MNPQDSLYSDRFARYYDQYSTGLDGDVKFYVEEASRAGSPVMELACGTGRVLIPIAQSGVEIVGVDRSKDMLSTAREKLALLDGDTRERIELVHGDMRSFYVDRKFKLIMIPYRSFCHLLTAADQRTALERVHMHLESDGLLILNLFDPRLDLLIADQSYPETPLRKHLEFDDAVSGNRVVVWATRTYDLQRQVLTEDRIFEELDGSGKMVSRSYSDLVLRYTFRYEMEHLLELSGFQIEALYGDFQRRPFRYGGEQVWVARRRG
ncbi:MAG: class I SAM-dependent methyltransferase [Chloroflexi bacterium]|nr:class I SAM-dependent methyltransferase [Chloroflexota bacterium]